MSPDPRTRISETKVQGEVVDRGKSYGMYCRKYKSDSNRGVPDYLCITTNGIPFFIEFKRYNKKPTKLQIKNMKAIERRGVQCFCCDDIEEGYLLMRDMHEIGMSDRCPMLGRGTT